MTNRRLIDAIANCRPYRASHFARIVVSVAAGVDMHARFNAAAVEWKMRSSALAIVLKSPFYFSLLTVYFHTTHWFLLNNKRRKTDAWRDLGTMRQIHFSLVSCARLTGYSYNGARIDRTQMYKCTRVQLKNW